MLIKDLYIFRSTLNQCSPNIHTVAIPLNCFYVLELQDPKSLSYELWVTAEWVISLMLSLVCTEKNFWPVKIRIPTVSTSNAGPLHSKILIKDLYIFRSTLSQCLPNIHTVAIPLNCFYVLELQDPKSLSYELNHCWMSHQLACWVEFALKRIFNLWR